MKAVCDGPRLRRARRGSPPLEIARKAPLRALGFHRPFAAGFNPREGLAPSLTFDSSERIFDSFTETYSF